MDRKLIGKRKKLDMKTYGAFRQPEQMSTLTHLGVFWIND